MSKRQLRVYRPRPDRDLIPVPDYRAVAKDLATLADLPGKPVSLIVVTDDGRRVRVDFE